MNMHPIHFAIIGIVSLAFGLVTPPYGLCLMISCSVAKVPLKVASTAEDIAQLVCFLASPASSNMTGEFVRMDAGMHLVL